MAKQEKVPKKKKEAEGQEEEVKANPEVIEKGEQTAKDLDELMDAIDDVLEENAEEFVKNYVQKGGQ